MIRMNNYSEMNRTEVAVIPKGTVITGNIEIEGKLEMHGTVNGDINSNDYVNICGDIKGNIKANDICTKDSFIEGSITCASSASVQENTVILGDIEAQELNVDGAIQGKIDVKGMVTLGDKAIVDSDIKAKSIQVSNGAAINGYCSLCYAEVTPKNFFPEEAAPAKEAKKQNKKSAS